MFEVPLIVQAPMAGGPSTPELAAAVSEAGGLGFVAAGYMTAEALADDVRRTRTLTGRPFGVNLFAAPGEPADRAAVEAYAATLSGEGELGTPRFDDDGLEAKLAVLREDPPAVVSFTFGCPSAATIAALDAQVWVTVTSADEARIAAERGADALVVQGAEAGGHRGGFTDDDADPAGLLALLQLVRAATDLPLIATGGIATGAAVAAVLAAGAVAAQIGTAFLLCPEAGTNAAQRAVVPTDRPTGLTRAFTGRRARGIVNRFQAEHSAAAPSAYPEVHHLTAPLRAAARRDGDADRFNLWAGQAHALARPVPAAEVVATLTAGAEQALSDAQARIRRR